jgi:predicted GNAT superfamily acetyltransferase
MPTHQLPHDMTIREVHTMNDLTATVELQKVIWRMQGEECTSAYVQNAVIHNGGNVLCAEHNGQMIGFTFAFPAKRGNDIWLWSHMAGVRPDYQGQGIGFMLKQKQRLWALDNGYTVIGWTFDPMQRGNANFNLNQLGAIVNKYYINHYGEMTDGINAGLASDRLEAYWELQYPHVIALANGQQESPDSLEVDTQFRLVYFNEEFNVVYAMPDALTEPRYYVEIPKSIATLKQNDLELAQEWQLVVRQAITHSLSQGYIVSGFINQDNRCWYVVTRQ